MIKSGEEAVYCLLDRMNEIGVDYMIVGSFSSNAYGVARATKDADFVIQISEEKRRALMDSLPKDFLVTIRSLLKPSPGTEGRS